MRISDWSSDVCSSDLMDRHCDNAIAVARYLSAHEKVEWVSYAGLEGDRYHALAKKYFKGRPSSLLTFGIKGGFDAGVKFYDALKMVKRLVNIGDTKTLARSEEHTSELQSLIRISYTVFCLKKK